MIFGDALVSELEEGERVEADDGYRGHAPEYVRCPSCIANPPPIARECSRGLGADTKHAINVSSSGRF